MKKLVVGILAHVDAGKTTLAESILYQTGRIRKLGRVDHKDAFLDTYDLERARGITIFSKQAQVTFDDMEVSLLDTPGHVDFSGEMERTLQVLDYAILVISGSDGVQGHTETLWKLLGRYQIPTFLFINKMDLEGTDRQSLMIELKKRLHDGCVDFGDDQNPKDFYENIALCDEKLLEQYMELEEIKTQEIATAIEERRIFPCYFGSALKLEGVDDFLYGLSKYTKSKKYPEEFGAKVYKIARDEQGNRLTYMKITGGNLKVKMLLSDHSSQWAEKVDQIRIYSGVKYDTVEELRAGGVCAVAGLSKTYPGEGLGIESGTNMPILEPVLNYQLLLPEGCDPVTMLSKLRQLEEEDPLLHIVWSSHLKEIHLQLMGEVQIEVLKSLILERFGVEVEFGTGNILYKETIAEPVVGVGHFEPLRHYAEVHLLLEPDEAGSGLTFDSNCSEDSLDRNWQRLILTHLEEKEHLGVLTGSPITDMKITLIAGRAHQKHTEGGDFRQATYRAVRQGLKKAKSILLEPYYDYKLEVPSEMIGRAMSDIQRMNGNFNPPEITDDMSILTGTAPVASMRGYLSEVTAYTKGRGRLFCSLKGYLPCHNPEEVIESIAYDSERDLDNPTGSVFCSHGAGFLVPWNQVENYMHIDNGYDTVKLHDKKTESLDEAKTLFQEEWKDLSKTIQREGRNDQVSSKTRSYPSTSLEEDKELEDIFVRTFGPIKQRISHSQNRLGYEKATRIDLSQRKQKNSNGNKDSRKEYLLVDGYNIIFAWEELSELAKENMDAARNKLMDILCNYQGFKQCVLILVFDAYKVKGGVGQVMDYHNIHVVYTKEAETADEYIEKVTHEMASKHQVTVATSDALEQLIIMGQGATRLSAKDLKEEIIRTWDQIQSDYLNKQASGRSYLGDQFDETLLEFLKKGYN